MGEIDYKKLSAKLVCVALCVLAIWLVFEYALAIVLPFLIAFCIGVPINKLSLRICSRIRLPRKLCAVLLVILSFGALGTLLYLGFSRFFSELEEYVSSTHTGTEGIGKALERLGERLPIISAGIKMLGEGIGVGFSGLVSEMAERGMAAMGSFAVELVKKAPRLIISLVISLISCFYFATDYERIKHGILSVFSGKTSLEIRRSGGMVIGALKKYAKAYLLIMLITFGEIFVGLLLIGVPYAFVIAAVVSVIDILPFFGTGIVLLPWAGVSFLMEDYRVGTGLLMLYGVITIVRQLIEPRIVGKSLGLHPLATLFSMFAGLSLFGFFGMLVAPLALIAFKEIGTNKKETE